MGLANRPKKRFAVGCTDTNRRRWFDDVQAAEDYARASTGKTGEETLIIDYGEKWPLAYDGWPESHPSPIANVRRDANDRIWTDVAAAPGQATLL